MRELSVLWQECEALVSGLMGVPLVGTAGGDYKYSPGVGLFVPGIESVIHETCHWIVAEPRLRKIENYGLVSDWASGDRAWDSSVLAEEEAFSLEYFMFDDPQLGVLEACMTCDALSTCSSTSAVYAWEHTCEPMRPSDALLARAKRARDLIGRELRQDGSSRMRAKVVELANVTGVPVDTIKNIASRWMKLAKGPLGETTPESARVVLAKFDDGWRTAKYENGRWHVVSRYAFGAEWVPRTENPVDWLDRVPEERAGLALEEPETDRGARKNPKPRKR